MSALDEPQFVDNLNLHLTNDIACGEHLPTNLHVFSDSHKSIAFDPDTFVILRMPHISGKLLTMMQKHPLLHVAEQMSGEASISDISRHYKYFKSLISRRILSKSESNSIVKPQLSHIVLMLSGSCNMACRYCFEKDIPNTVAQSLMSSITARTALEWFFSFHEGPHAHIEYYGGEPLLNFDRLTEITNISETWSQQSGKTLSKYLITNATLITEQIAKYFAEHNFEIQVSIDGAQRHHDKYRVYKNGKASYDVIVQNLEILRKNKVNYNVRSVLCSGNTNILELVDSLKQLGTTQLSFEVVTTNDPNIRLSECDWGTYYKSLKQYLSSADGSNYQDVKRIIERINSRQKVYYGCGAGRREFTIGPNGEIYDCQRIFRSPLGNINSKTSPAQLTTTFTSCVTERSGCRDCWARYLCGGGCLNQSFVEGRGDHPFEYFCTAKKIICESAISYIAAASEPTR